MSDEDQYKYISINDWHSAPGNKVKEYLDKGKDGRYIKPTYKILEAEKMRNALKFFTDVRLSYLSKNQEIMNYPEMSYFIDHTPGYNCMFLVMSDFYKNKGTSRGDLLDAIGKRTTTGDRDIQKLVKTGTLAATPSSADTRIKVFVPTVVTILLYEFVIAPHYWSRWLDLRNDSSNSPLSNKTLAIETILWHKLHKKHMPAFLHVELNKCISSEVFERSDLKNECRAKMQSKNSEHKCRA